jgi:hypothetical protein
VELFAAPGAATSWNPSFRLVGDVANGGLAVQSSQVPQTAVLPLQAGIVATRFAIGFTPLVANGPYTVQIGPNIADAFGNLMDQDKNGQNGEPSDVYTGTFTIARQPLRVIAQDPSAKFVGVLDHIDVTFSARILASSLSPAAVQLLGPQGFVNITGVALVSGNQYRISFAPVTANGNYTVQISPQVRDLGGVLMDQDNV